MTTRPFPGCCAGYIINGFGNTQFTVEATSSKEQIRQYFQNRKQTYFGHDNDGFDMVIINHQQENIMIPILKEFGYRRIAKDIYHPSHHSYIHIYILEYQRKNPANKRRNQKK